MGRKQKPRTLAEQNRRLCGSICLCQLTVVLSSVSLIYLSVAIYMPSHRAFHSGYEPEPVMCQTTRTNNVNNCNWASCGEWCLTKTTGFCPQIHVTVRRNGTDVLLQNCTSLNSVSCPPADPTSLKRYNCNQGSECEHMRGIFNCSLGHCGNYSELFLCRYKSESNPLVLDTAKDNMKLNGFFECNKHLCTKIKRGLSCDRYCTKITTTSVNVFLMYEDNLYTGECQRAVALNQANGREPGTPVNETEVWTESRGVLLASCLSVTKAGNNSLRATDCVNGTVLDAVPEPYINFTTFWALYANSTRPLDPQQRFLPAQSALTIYNQSRLFINLEGCVNTLRGECRDFLASHGRDGRNDTAVSRFPCYYNKLDGFMAVARFDLGKTFRELLIATVVPSVLFVVSFVTLVIITKYVKVGDDGKMQCTMCRCCGGGGGGGGARGSKGDEPRDADSDGLLDFYVPPRELDAPGTPSTRMSPSAPPLSPPALPYQLSSVARSRQAVSSLGSPRDEDQAGQAEQPGQEALHSLHQLHQLHQLQELAAAKAQEAGEDYDPALLGVGDLGDPGDGAVATQAV